MVESLELMEKQVEQTGTGLDLPRLDNDKPSNSDSWPFVVMFPIENEN